MAILNQDLAVLVTKASRDKVAGMTSTKALLDAMFADGIKPDDLLAPKGNADRVFYEGLRDAVVAGFSKSVQALLAANVKSLNEDQKAMRLNWQQQIGSILKDWRKGLERRIAQAEASESDGAGTRKASSEAIIRRELAALIERAEKLESSTIKDLPAFIAALKAALARVPA